MSNTTKIMIAILSIFASVTTQAYDYTIKDKYGNTTGYLDTDDKSKTHVIDKYGTRTDYIESDGTIKDNFKKMRQVG